MNGTLTAKTLSLCKRQSLLLRSMHQAHTQFLQGKDIMQVFGGMLEVVLEASESQYGFIGEMLSDINGKPYLKTHAYTNISWNREASDFHKKNTLNGLEIYYMKTLFGRVIKNGKYLISNSPYIDQRSGGLPEGLPKMDSFMGIPFFFNKELIGIIGIANRPGGYDISLVKQLDPILSTCATIIKSFREKKGHEMMIRKLEEKSAEFETFMYRASHDLRGPVSTIKGLVQISDTESKKTFVHQCMEMVGECANKLDNTLVDLRDIVKIKQSEAEISEIDLETIVKMQISIFQGSRNFNKIKWNITSRVKQPFYSDLTLINIIIQNILDNSIKYINQVEREPHIQVDISVAENSCLLVISDNGPGIREEYLDKVFQMFFRGNEISDGTGVGLYLVKNAVDKLEGEIEISSEFNKGCSLKIALPINNPQKKSKAEKGKNQLKNQLANK